MGFTWGMLGVLVIFAVIVIAIAFFLNRSGR